MAVADLDEAKLTLSMLLPAVAVAKAVRLQDSAPQHTPSARPRPSHALQKSPAVNSVALVVNLDFIMICCLRRPSLHHLILRESLRFGIHCAEPMSAGFIP
jgi:hypothetical protein